MPTASSPRVDASTASSPQRDRSPPTALTRNHTTPNRRSAPRSSILVLVAPPRSSSERIVSQSQLAFTASTVAALPSFACTSGRRSKPVLRTEQLALSVLQSAPDASQSYSRRSATGDCSRRCHANQPKAIRTVDGDCIQRSSGWGQRVSFPELCFAAILLDASGLSTRPFQTRLPHCSGPREAFSGEKPWGLQSRAISMERHMLDLDRLQEVISSECRFFLL